MEKRIFKKLVAVLMIITILATDFFVLGSNLITYAVQINGETNNSNIEFSVYFKNGKNRVDSIEKSIKDDNLKLYAEIKVKNEGYFNGTIEIQNSNFDIVSSNIGIVDGNKVNLNQLNAGDVVEVELGINPVIEDKISVDMLSKISTVKLTGKYIYSQAETGETIQAEKEVCVNYQPDELAQAELETDIITNKVLSVDGENKRIVQILVKSKLTENQYPIQQTILDVTIPELSGNTPEKINVLAIGELATNGNETISTDEWENESDNLKINLKNEIDSNNKICWSKNVYDELVVTYIYDENVAANKIEIKAESEIKLYNAKKTYTATYTKEIENQEPNNVIMGKTEVITSEMYKGQIYAKVDALYNTKTSLIITNANTVDSVIAHEGTDVFETSESELIANTKYVSTQINKEKMLGILGQDGKIEIKDGTATIVINKDTEVNENGNIVITYQNGAVGLDITTSKPDKSGLLELTHTKSIIANTYTREQLQTVKTIKTRSSIVGIRTVEENNQNVVENFTEARLELKETITKAELTVDKENLSTTVTNENVILGIKLITDGLQYDLYKNPTIKIQLPASVESIRVNSTDRLYAKDFGKPTATYEESTKTLIISLEGEQTAYPESSATQLYLQLNLNITLSKIEPSHKDKITMTYSNENATQYYGGTTDFGVVTKQIQISSPSGLVKMLNLRSNKNISTTETITQVVSSEEAGKDVSFEVALINNTGSDIDDVRVIGKLPTTGNTVEGQENTFETVLKNIEAQNATIYYTENVEATDDVEKSSNGWTTNLAELTNAKMYLIKLESLSNVGNYTATVDVTMPNSIPENVLSYTDYTVVYDTEYETDVEDSSRTIALMTSLVAGLETKLTAQVGGDTLSNGDKVKAGEVIKYTAEVTNNTTTTLENVELKAGVPEGTVVVEPIQSFELEDEEKIEQGGYVYADGYYEEKEDIQEISEFISLNPGQTYTKQYEVRVKKNITEGAEISNKAVITYDSSKIETDEIKNVLEEASVRVTIKRAVDTSIQLIAGSYIDYIIYIENLSNEKIKDLNVTLDSDNINITSIIQGNDQYKYDESIKEIFIDKIPANEISQIKISGTINRDAKEISTSVIVTDKNKVKYKSNEVTETLPYTDVAISLSSPQSNKNIKAGDTIEYNIVAENTGSISGSVTIRDVISEYFKVKAIYVNKELIKQTSDITDEETYLEMIENGITETINLNVGEKVEVDIISDVYYSAYEEDVVVNNIAKVDFMGVQVNKAEVTHTLKNTSKIQSASGLVWLDENDDNKIDRTESILKDIKLKLYDVENKKYATDENGNVLQAVTDNYGEYKFLNIEKGSYIIVVDYDAEKYVPTTNSEVKSQKLTINGESVTVVGTETISIQDNVSNINIGLKERDILTPGENPENPEQPGNPDNPENPENPEEPTNPDIPVDTKSISGLAWVDLDRDGKKDGNENGLPGIKVRIYYVSTRDYLKDNNGNIVETITDENGKYIFDNIEEGTYIILFEYNTEKYEPTIYMGQGIDTTENSKAVSKEININGENKILAVTDTIKVQEDVANINIGLKEKLIFDLELDKYISRIVVQNNKGTKAYNYKDSTFEKVEIHRKQVEGSLVVLEYTIKIKNNGEISGYAKNIVDYIPSGLTFSSELNTDWYLSGGNLYTKGLENDEIEPGEEKEIKLILTKTMTNENVGLINNRAEIYQDYNTYGESDTDSTPNNQIQSEDDFGSADVIIGVSTGGSTIAYFILLIINMALIGIAIKLMIKNRIIKISTKKGRR